MSKKSKPQKQMLDSFTTARFGDPSSEPGSEPHKVSPPSSAKAIAQSDNQVIRRAAESVAPSPNKCRHCQAKIARRDWRADNAWVRKTGPSTYSKACMKSPDHMHHPKELAKPVVFPELNIVGSILRHNTAPQHLNERARKLMSDQGYEYRDELVPSWRKKVPQRELAEPYTEFATIKPEYRASFDQICEELEPIVERLVGTMTFRDLYDVMGDAATVVVGRFVSKRDKKETY